MTEETLQELYKLARAAHAITDFEVKARALLARQPAAIDKQEAKEKCPNCNGTGSHGGRFHTDGKGATEYEPYKCDMCEGFGTVAAPLANEASKPAPSVEQDERGALAQAAIRMLEGYAESYDSMARMDDPNGNGTVQCRSVAQDIRHNMAGWIKARAASTSANVAQGAEMHICGECDRQFRAAPPAQTALTDAIINIAANYMQTGDLYDFTKEVRALTAAQSASGDTK
jgi:hypothetical protein